MTETQTVAVTYPHIVAGLQGHVVPIDTLTEHPQNARRGDVDAIAISLQTHGQYRPAVVQRSTGYVCAGNHMMRAMRGLGYTHVAATVLDIDDDQALQILTVDNRSSDIATNDQDALAAILEHLDAQDKLVGTGYDAEDLAELLASLDRDAEPFAGLTDPDDLPDRAPAITKPGDVWLLGPHRLMCGDQPSP